MNGSAYNCAIGCILKMTSDIFVLLTVVRQSGLTDLC